MCLTVSDIDSTGTAICSNTYCTYVYVGYSPTGCQANFGYYTTSSNEIDFYNYSSGNINSWYWSFGDSTYSSLQNPTHTYASSGTYYVCLTGSDIDSNGNVICSSTYCTNVVIVIIPRSCSALFYTYPDSTTLYHYIAVNMATGIQPLTYLWSWGDGTSDSTPYPSHTYSAVGNYTVCLTITDSVGCTSTYCDSVNSVIAINVTKPAPSGIKELTGDSRFTLFPNPANDNITIEIFDFSKDETISVYDIQGQLLMQQPMLQAKTNVDISSFTKGIYFIKVASENGVEVKKFMKE